MNYLIVTVVILTALAATGFLFCNIRVRNRERAIRALLDRFPGSVTKFLIYPTLKGNFQGVDFLIELLPPARALAECLKISLIKSNHLEFKIRKEDILDNFVKKLGVVRVIKVNDESFNRDFLIFSSNPSQASAYLDNENIRNIVRELFTSGFDEIRTNNREVIIQKSYYSLERDLDAEFLKNILQKLIFFSKEL